VSDIEPFLIVIISHSQCATNGHAAKPLWRAKTTGKGEVGLYTLLRGKTKSSWTVVGRLMAETNVYVTSRNVKVIIPWCENFMLYNTVIGIDALRSMSQAISKSRERRLGRNDSDATAFQTPCGISMSWNFSLSLLHKPGQRKAN
jgi:hypothetical protein